MWGVCSCSFVEGLFWRKLFGHERRAGFEKGARATARMQFFKTPGQSWTPAGCKGKTAFESLACVIFAIHKHCIRAPRPIEKNHPELRLDSIGTYDTL